MAGGLGGECTYDDPDDSEVYSRIFGPSRGFAGSTTAG